MACSAAEEPDGPADGAPPASSIESPAASQTQTPETSPAQAFESGYDPTENMFRLYSRRNHNPVESHEAIELAVANKDKSMVPVMIEALRFFINTALEPEINRAIAEITGEEVKRPANAWHEWMEWLGRNADEYSPPEGYVDWKIEVMNLIDPQVSKSSWRRRSKARGSTYSRSPGEASGPTVYRTFRAPRSFRRRSRTTSGPATGSLACPSTGSTGRTPSAL